ncbi:MAG: hypothetical protein HYY20_02905 [Candidatus Tectomicrobia bacterium]|uniref:SprT-like domain-containing protein n=1 Tax=Tectimicrobiota bacterium TaxID=2528274 RepID=A0A932CM51_UNCTE|nr:hypothetical protein [Candidatus Tectomicrobia bacterium]
MVRIQGIVRLANAVRQKLQTGILPGEVPEFQEFIRRNVKQIEELCRQAKTTPRSLPSPSHKAYLFLKGLDLERLPLRREAVLPLPSKRVRISNVVKSYKAFLEWISVAAAKRASIPTERGRIVRSLREEVAEIERICLENGASPRDLEDPSRRAYGWMKFLTQEDHLERHLETVSRGMEILRQVGARHGLGPRKLLFQLVQQAAIYCRKTGRDAISVQASEGFLDADDKTLEALAHCVLVGRDGQWRQRVEAYVDSETYADILFEVEEASGLGELQGRGRHYDLKALFEKINAERFQGKLDPPGLTWSRTFTFRKFGHYHPTRDLVMISLTLDDPGVPPFVIEFVLYHELLHKKLGIRREGSIRRAHTEEFRREERRFPHYQDAEAWLVRLATQLQQGKGLLVP